MDFKNNMWRYTTMPIYIMLNFICVINMRPGNIGGYIMVDKLKSFLFASKIKIQAGVALKKRNRDVILIVICVGF